MGQRRWGRSVSPSVGARDEQAARHRRRLPGMIRFQWTTIRDTFLLGLPNALLPDRDAGGRDPNFFPPDPAGILGWE
ncbi:MAG: hypothetical protein QME79_02320 [Bacillota bacterium]|nr:hypothetical protein [Bacillota bacterium]